MRSRSTSPTLSDSDSDFDDLITPCQPQQQKQQTHEIQDAANRTSRAHAQPLSLPFSHPSLASYEHGNQTPPRYSGRRCSTDASVDAYGLWCAMLALQQRYHCYNSARMQIAADSDRPEDMMPSRACIDLLNDSIENLPEEGWKVLEHYLARDDRQ